MIADLATLSRVLPSLAAVCGEEGLIFQGTTEALGDLPATAVFTDLQHGSPAHGGTFCVPLPFTAPELRTATSAQRKAFANAMSHASSWGGPDGFDSGSDYQTF